MGRVLTNNTSFSVATESTPGVLPGSPTWYGLEPNTIQSFGDTLRSVARRPISKNRQRRKGTIIDADSSIQYEGDLTMSSLLRFLDGFVFSDYQGTVFVPTAVTGSDQYTVPSGGALAAGTLVYARGFTNSENNGLKVLDSGSTGTTIEIVETLVAEASPPINVLLEVAGVQGASGDIEVDSNGDIISTTLDFTTLPLTAGQAIWVGGATSSTQFATAANTGYARVMVIEANKLTLDKKATTFVTDAGTGKTIQLLFGRFVRNVSVDHADYLENSYQFEASYPNLGSGGATEYEYGPKNYCNELTLNLPLTDKATLGFNFIGGLTEDFVTSQKTNADTPILPVSTEPLNTSADIARLRVTQVDETGLTTDFKNMTLKLGNGVSAEKTLGTLGARYLNVSIFTVDIDATLIFTSSDVVQAIKNNTTVTMDFTVKNNDGAVFFDIPALTLGGGGREFPLDESVRLRTTGEAFEDPTLGTSLGVSIFPYVP